MYGDPVDEEYWAANNPANVAVANGDAIRASGLEILIEAGDRDFFNLHEATEFLHRVLWDRDIDHEYHLVRRADHVGITVPPRIDAAIRFAGRALIPDSRPDPDRDRLHQGPYGDAKRAADERSPRWRGEFAARD
jgi:S-formylglutathione hydrolase